MNMNHQDAVTLAAKPAVVQPANAGEVIVLVKQLLRQYLAVNRPDFAEDLGDNMSFDYIGLDSLARVELLTQLEKSLGIPLDPTSAYDFVTARALGEFIWSTVSATPMDMKEAMGV